jgi:transposase
LDTDRYRVAVALVTALRWPIVSPMFEAGPTPTVRPHRHAVRGHLFMRQRSRYAGIFGESTRVERTREAQRLEKELEDAGIKISSVATDILGASGRAMLAALIAGEDDAQVMADMARGRLRTKIPALAQALTGNFGEHHSFLCRLHLTRIDELSATIEELSARIDAEMRPFAHQIEHLVTIPGVKKRTAEVIIAETGADMTRLRTPANLASWAGVCPGHHESAGIHRSGKRRHGNRWLGGALGTAAMAAGRTRERTYLGARYARLVPRLGKQKTIVAVEHSILIAVWHMLSDNVNYHDLGGDYFTKQDPQRAIRRIIRQANDLGLTSPLRPHP